MGIQFCWQWCVWIIEVTHGEGGCLDQKEKSAFSYFAPSKLWNGSNYCLTPMFYNQTRLQATLLHPCKFPVLT